MIERDLDAALLTEFYEYIQEPEVKRAFELLVGSFVCRRTVTCRATMQGAVRSFRIYQDGKWMFSVMPSQQRLHFQWRPPAIACGLFDKAIIAGMFEEFSDQKQEEHWSVQIRSIASALQLLQALDLK